MADCLIRDITGQKASNPAITSLIGMHWTVPTKGNFMPRLALSRDGRVFDDEMGVKVFGSSFPWTEKYFPLYHIFAIWLCLMVTTYSLLWAIVM